MESLTVSDSSPIISFARARKLHLIREIYNSIIVPPAVFDEIVVKGKDKPGSEEIRKASWIEVRSPKNQKKVERLKEEFGAGESEAVVLSEEIKAVLLADEWRVIKEARRRGLRITRTLLTLEKAKRKGLIESVKKEIDDLIASGFRTTPALIKDALQKVGEVTHS